jgi:site-specific DNA-methyltransferase (adenine-specific)
MSFYLELVPDSFEYMKGMATGSYDVTITDPPYDEHCHANMTSGTAMKKLINGELKAGGIPRVQMKFDSLSSYEWAYDLTRVSKRWALAFCTVEDLGRISLLLGRKLFVRSGIWYKSNSMGQLTGDRPAAAYEGVAIMHNETKKAWNGRGSYGIWRCSGTRGKVDRHPNEKPLDLALKLVALFSNRGETIFDPFCGSGAIGEAALRLGRLYVGLDNDPEWIAKATKRLASVEFGGTSDQYALGLCRMKG